MIKISLNRVKERLKAHQRLKLIKLLGIIFLCILMFLILFLNVEPANMQKKTEYLSVPDFSHLQTEWRLTVNELKSELNENISELKQGIGSRPKKNYTSESRQFSIKQDYEYQSDIKPIFNKKCIVCHACYDAPCQLKMESDSGLLRGASKIKVYDGDRLEDIEPTRLDVDAQSYQQWRERGFFSVLNAIENKQQSSIAVFQAMLDLGHNQPLPADRKVPDRIKLGFDRTLSCPTQDNFDDYSDKHPNEGMPLAVTGLSDKEYQTLSTWMSQGAKVSPPEITLTPLEKKQIKRWETWFNKQDNRSKLLARYLYEHLFLAHLYIEETNPDGHLNFFKLIRSYTPPGKQAVPVATVRPNDQAQSEFYYRLIPITETIVHKTHITYAFGSQRQDYFDQLFFQSDWKVDTLPGYSEAEQVNPFSTFQAIPAKSRYRFLLNDGEFFVRNFIRGPVCRGQIATDVIRDQFWVMFEDPDHEQYVNHAPYRKKINHQLSIPETKSSIFDQPKEWFNFQNQRYAYLDQRKERYNNSFPKGAQFDHIWHGNSTNTNAFLSVFRHHTSASVKSGWHGELPQTVWLMDYPLLERSLYELVIGFNVFGGITHQAQTRLYFDLIRNESEKNFLRLLPASERETVYDQWYQGLGQIKSLISYYDLDNQSPTNIVYKTNDSKDELLEKLLIKSPVLAHNLDKVNRCQKACKPNTGNSFNDLAIQTLSQLAAKPAKKLPVIHWLPEVSFLRVDLPNQDFLVYSLVRNRRHSNVAFMLGESLRYQVDMDSLTVLPGLIGSYPNLMFQLELTDLDTFTRHLNAVNSDKDFEQLIEHWGVRRMSKGFWDNFHSFSTYMQKHDPINAGLYDMNRYGHW